MVRYKQCRVKKTFSLENVVMFFTFHLLLEDDAKV